MLPIQDGINTTSKTIPNQNHDSYLLPLESGKGIALTMNFPQQKSSVSKVSYNEDNKIQQQSTNEQSQCNHIATDPHGCLDCMSTMFGPNYAPFAALSRIPNLDFLLFS